jgi:7-carboxy-7-deazaguanine synthase
MAEKTIKVAEIFYSVQGEGIFAGVPSVFIRTFGCNFECRGFGLPQGEMTREPERIATIIKAQREAGKEVSYDLLPLANSGCDSYASWHKDFKDLSPKMTLDEIVETTMHHVDSQRLFRDASGTNHEMPHIIITGGEPLLGWQRAYPELIDKFYDLGFREFTFETNGTQKLSADLKDYLLTNAIKNKKINLTFSVSAKLPCSGELWEQAIVPEVVCEYEKYGNAYLKLVVANEQDVMDANAAVTEYQNAGFKGPVYLMPSGGTNEEYDLTAPQVANLCMEYGYRYSPRLQVDLFKNAWGT